MSSAPERSAADALVERARAGDGVAFRELFRLHVARVGRMLHRLVGSSHDLDDLTQTVFIECFRSLPGFRGEALFSTWLGRITVRVAMHAVRRPRLQLVPLDEEHDGETASVDPERARSSREVLRGIDRLLDGLKPKHRVVFVLHVIEGYSVEETAALVGRSAAAVKLRLRGARKVVERRALKDPVLAELCRGR
jgi:RNA polymerase sigma-70 factor (ECF subfamily)